MPAAPPRAGAWSRQSPRSASKPSSSEVLEIGWKPVVLMIVETLFIAALALVAIAGRWV
jgi:hypothetical protein